MQKRLTALKDLNRAKQVVLLKLQAMDAIVAQR
jgi:hypothetical protein